MLERDLVEKQNELDLLKFNQSSMARADLAGKMAYCKGCMFRTDMPGCSVEHETRQKYYICARQFFQTKKEVENDKLTIQPRKTRKRSNG